MEKFVGATFLGFGALYVYQLLQSRGKKQKKEEKRLVESFIPGPTWVPPDIREVYTRDYLSPDIEEDFFQLYKNTQNLVARLLGVPSSSTVLIQSGEAMVSLWGGLNSVIDPGSETRVLAIANGLFGYGIADMAKGLKAKVEVIGYEWNEIPTDMKTIQSVAERFRPHIVTAVHCETPSGTLTITLKEIGKIARSVGALFYVDFVSSAFGAPLNVEECNIDIGLLGSQKALSLPPDLGIVTVSERCWKRIEEVKYQGYDAYLPFKEAIEKKYFPYTMNWRGIEALYLSLQKIQAEGLENVYRRHAEVAHYVRHRVIKMGLKLYAETGGTQSPTVTTVYLPRELTWATFSALLRKEGWVVGGNYSKLHNVTFRLGHMGSQANMDSARGVCDAVERVLANSNKG